MNVGNHAALSDASLERTVAKLERLLADADVKPSLFSERLAERFRGLLAAAKSKQERLNEECDVGGRQEVKGAPRDRGSVGGPG
jgi:hypothetical protein